MVVCLLGFVSIMSLINEPLPTEDYDFASIEPGQSSPQRQVASVLDSAHAVVTPEPVVEVVEIDCAQENQTLETSSARIRVRGDSCLKKSSALAADTTNTEESTQVRNISNGFVATIFRRAPASYTTDYINLSEGKNELEIVFKVGETVSTKKITVSRKDIKK